MRILLVSPSTTPESKTPAALMIPQLGLHILEGLTPPEHEVKVVEEEVSEINLEEPCDLVGISCMTATAPRAYHLADEFRQRGRKVVLGGVRPSILPAARLFDNAHLLDRVVRAEQVPETSWPLGASNH